MTTIKENSLTISNIYKSRKIILKLLKARDYEVDEWDDFSINEIQSMYSNNQLDMLLKHKTNGKKIYIKYYIQKKLGKTNVYDYVDDKKWFDLLKAKSLEAQDPESTHRMIFELIEDSKLSEDKDFLLEVLYLLTQSSNQELFVLTLKKIMPQIIVEEEFRDILESCQEFFQFSDLEESEQLVCKILKKRDKLDLEKDINPQDSDLKELIDIVQRPYSLS